MDRYLEPVQSRQGPPTPYEDQLGDALERAFAAGHYDLAALVLYLNQSGPPDMNGATWTEASFAAAMQRLGSGA